MKARLFFSVSLLLSLLLGSTGKMAAEDTARVLVPKEVFTEVADYDTSVRILLHNGPAFIQDAERGRLGRVKALLSAKFKAALKDCSVLTYTTEGIDKKFNACSTELKAAEERITKVIVESTSTIPAAVLEQVVHEAEEKVMAQMNPKIAALEARIEALERQLASSGGPIESTKGE